MPIGRVIGAIILLFALSGSLHSQELSQEKDFNIPPQSLARAVIQFSDQSGIQVVTAGQDVSKLTTEGVKGRLKIREALKVLLNGTHLGYSLVGNSTVALVSLASSANSVTSSSESTDDQGGASDSALTRAQNRDSPTASSSAPPNAEKTAMTEIIVTAQKQGQQRLQDVPIPISVVNTQQLVDDNQTSLKDYYNTIPGLNIAQVGSQGQQLLVIRGINTGFGGQPTVGITVDDAPFSPTTGVGGGDQIPDIDPNDLERIEVLRGPQGSLYGTSSMGGLIRYVTKDPTTDGFSGRVTAGGSAIQNGAEAGYNFRASANVPLNSDLAVRVSGYTRQDPGYVDNILSHVDGVNEDHATGGMLMAKWMPSQSVTLKVRASYQQVRSDGSSDVSVGLSDLQQNFPPGIGGTNSDTQAYSALLTAKLGGVDLTSVTGYNVLSVHASTDFGNTFGLTAQGIYGPNAYAPFFNSQFNRSFSQELRFSGVIGPQLEWLAGGFYTNQRAPSFGYFYAQSTAGQLTNLVSYDTPTNYREYAGFGTLTYHFTDRFAVQLGGRESHIETHFSQTNDGLFYNFTPVFQPQPPASNNVFTYLLTPQFKVTPDFMVYARLASGYRPGGSNGFFPGITNGPPQYNADKTQNYELGVKADLLDHKFSLDASIYYIDWKDIQLTEGNNSYTGNAGGAKSEGVELSLTSRPLPGLIISGWVAYDDAALTQATPPGSIYGLPGFRLPYVSRWSGNVSLEQNFPLVSAAEGFVGAQVSLVGDRSGEFAPSATTPERQDYPSYTQVNLRAGTRWSSWAANIFANNVTDKRGLIGGGIGGVPPTGLVIIQPRTVGLNVTRTF